MGMEKKYVLETVYGNDKVLLLYHDGVLVDRFVLSDFMVKDSVDNYEKDGYERAYYVPQYYKAMQEAKRELEKATKAFEEASKYPLILSEEEAGKYEDMLF